MTKSALRGQLSPWTLPGLLRELHSDRRAGLLSLEQGEAKRALRFRDGRIVAAFTNVEGERLPERLVALGLVAEGDLEAALGVMRREAKTLADVLEDRGLVDRAGLDRALAEQVRDILDGAFSPEPGTYHFQEQAPSGGEDVGHIATEDMILEAVRRITDPSAVRYALGETDRTLVLARGLRLEQLKLTAADGYFLSRVDGTLTGREVIEMLPLDADEAQRTLLGLLCAGIVELQGPVKATFKPADMATRASERALELGIAPPPSAAAGRPDERPAPARPSVPEATMEEEVAEESLAKAQFEMAEGRPTEAARILETVVDLVEGNMRCRVRRLLAEALLSDPRSEKRGEGQLHILVAESPGDVEAYFMLGSVYQRRGLRSRADTMFRHVLDLNPAHAGARAALESPAAEAPKPAKTASTGLWGRLLGR